MAKKSSRKKRSKKEEEHLDKLTGGSGTGVGSGQCPGCSCPDCKAGNFCSGCDRTVEGCQFTRCRK